MPIERYYTPEELVVGSAIDLVEAEMHHMVRVVRTRVGDRVELVNGRGILAAGVLRSVDKRSARVDIEAILEEERSTKVLVLAQAFPKGNKIDFIIEKGTELGVSEFWLFPGKKSEKKDISEQLMSRLNALAVAAMKQSGRLILPKIILKPELAHWNDIPYPILYGDIDSGAPSLVKQELRDGVVFVTGPESGLTEKEIEHLKDLGGKGVSLNRQILRTETASIVAVGILAIL